jgi:hypothetical protein
MEKLALCGHLSTYLELPEAAKPVHWDSQRSAYRASDFIHSAKHWVIWRMLACESR